MRFSEKELLDLAIAWGALGLAFSLFFAREAFLPTPTPAVAGVLATNLLTVGLGFLLHELAHKVVAVRFGQIAEFRADYAMLAFAVVGGLAGFIFAAPGAVFHRGALTQRESGLIALAGPATNLGLAAAFVPVAILAPELGHRGVQINLLLAAFNMLPVGQLDGRTVLGWNRGVYALVTVLAIGLTVLSFVQ